MEVIRLKLIMLICFFFSSMVYGAEIPEDQINCTYVAKVINDSCYYKLGSNSSCDNLCASKDGFSESYNTTIGSAGKDELCGKVFRATYRIALPPQDNSQALAFSESVGCAVVTKTRIKNGTKEQFLVRDARPVDGSEKALNSADGLFRYEARRLCQCND